MKLGNISLKKKLNTIIMFTSMNVLLLSSGLCTAIDITEKKKIEEKLQKITGTNLRI